MEDNCRLVARREAVKYFINTYSHFPEKKDVWAVLNMKQVNPFFDISPPFHLSSKSLLQILQKSPKEWMKDLK